MKNVFVAAVTLAAAALTARAAIVVQDPAYAVTTLFTHTNADRVVSFDWDASGRLYYMTGTSGFRFGGLYRYAGGASTTLVAPTSDFVGASVVSIGDYVYYNTFPIYKYGPLSTGGTNTVATTAANYGLATSGGGLFIAAGAFGEPTHLYYSTLNAAGNLITDPPLEFGTFAGATGPLSFDLAGNLYYAPGSDDLSIYRFTASEVSLALSDPAQHALNKTGHLWVEYGSLYPAYVGGTSIGFDGDGDLLLTLTDFGSSSLLAKFDVAPTGAYSGTTSGILHEDGLLGEVRLHAGQVYFSDGNSVYGLVPEPSSALLLATAAAWLGGSRRGRQRLGKA